MKEYKFKILYKKQNEEVLSRVSKFNKTFNYVFTR